MSTRLKPHRGSPLPWSPQQAKLTTGGTLSWLSDAGGEPVVRFRTVADRDYVLTMTQYFPELLALLQRLVDWDDWEAKRPDEENPAPLCDISADAAALLKKLKKGKT